MPGKTGLVHERLSKVSVVFDHEQAHSPASVREEAFRAGHQFRIRQLAEPRLAYIPTIVFTAVHVDAPMRQALGEVLVLSKPAGLGPLIAAVAEAAEPRGHVTKRCECGLVYDSGAWRTLPKIGEIDNGREVGERIELRNCTCASTLAWELGHHARFVPAPRK